MCLCSDVWLVQVVGMRVCSRCGITRHRPVYIRQSSTFCCTSRPPYSRRKRFGRLLENVWGARISTCCTPLIKSLQEIKPHSSGEIYRFIRASKCRQFKRYDAVANLSTKLIPDHKILPLSDCERVWAMACFQNVESRHQKIQGCFPAYAFLIELVLLHSRPCRRDLLPYLHTLKCSKRRGKYEQLYGDIFRRPGVNPCTPASH